MSSTASSSPGPAASGPPVNSEAILREFVGGERGRALRVELASGHRRRSAEEIDDAVQAACARFVGVATDIKAPGQVYTWIRTTANRLLLDQDDRQVREVSVDPIQGVALRQAIAPDSDPAEEVLAQADEDEMKAFIREVFTLLSDRRGEVLALYAEGQSRAAIGDRLGISDRTVELELMKIMDAARTHLAARAGGGCIFGEPLVLRFAYGLASAAESEQAEHHLDRCHRCHGLYDRLVEWRDKAAEFGPAPAAAEAASPGLLGRLGHKVADAVSSAKQQLLGTAAQAKQQAAATYYRAVDPTPLAGVRPSAVAAVVASCLTVGGGAAAYCANQGVDPIGAATSLIAGSEGEKPEPPPVSSAAAEPTPEAPVVTTPTYETAPPEEETTTATEASPPESSSPPEKNEPARTAPEPEPLPEPEPTPEPEFVPTHETETPEAAPEATAPETSASPTEIAKPAPVPAHSASEFEP